MWFVVTGQRSTGKNYLYPSFTGWSRIFVSFQGSVWWPSAYWFISIVKWTSYVSQCAHLQRISGRFCKSFLLHPIAIAWYMLAREVYSYAACKCQADTEHGLRDIIHGKAEAPDKCQDHLHVFQVVHSMPSTFHLFKATSYSLSHYRKVYRNG